MMMSEVAVLYHENFLKHFAGRGHPESPERLEAIMTAVTAEGLLEKLHKITPVPASEEVVALVHDPHYIQWVADKCLEGPGYLDRGDTVVCNDTYRVALLAAGAVIAAADWVMERENRRAFCVVRPPGHHAEPDRAMGFCIFNNIAICARYLQVNHQVRKVLIVDWDVHHGNGTQRAFYVDPSVFYFSVHEYPYYPGSGAEDEEGRGSGMGATLNVPLRAGSDDEDYIRAFHDRLVPAADRFSPDIVLISAGFDAHMDDPLAAMCVTDDGFAEMTRIVKEIAEKHSEGRIVSVLEGGYSLKGMSASVVRFLKVLSS